MIPSSSNPPETDALDKSVEESGADMVHRDGGRVPSSGWWKPSCGAAPQYLKAGQQFPAHHPADVWYPAGH